MYQFPEDMKKCYESSPISFVYYQNIDGRAVPVLASSGFCDNTGITRDKVLSWLARGMFERIHPDDVGVVSTTSESFLRGCGSYDVVFRCRIGSDYIWIHGLGKWQTMPDGTRLAVINYTNISSAQEIIHEKMDEYLFYAKDRFYTDPLTELPNINYLHKFGEERVDIIRDENKTPMVIYSDVFSMQSYNNHYGFGEGDNLLKLITDTLKKIFPEALIIRGADDHFIMLTDVDRIDELQDSLERANMIIRKNACGNTSGLRSGICPVEGSLVEALDHARHALKRIETNVNQISRVFSREADDAYWRNRYIVEGIDNALENGWIRVFYQGLFRMKTRKLAAFEALARWIDPNRGIISPAAFIPALQKYHLLYKLDLYMFEQVCKEIPVRYENGLPLLPVSVNFSRQDFDHADVIARMNEIYEKYQISKYVEKDYFIIEITEQEVAANPERCELQVRKIKESGYRLWLDDFGSGYSSFSMFSRFQFDLIKYDMELIRHLDDNNGANRLILKDLVHLAKGLKLHTLIEGVETKEQLEFVESIGCELIQGYYYHKPESLDEILFRIRCGDKVKPCETPEERDELNAKWFAEN